jgi:hypothetical protein
LFLIFINNLDLAASEVSTLAKFADDTKLGQVIVSEDDRIQLQRALDKLCDWSRVWGMSFNVKMCKVMHFGRRNPQYDYEMNGEKLERVEEERDIGVTVQKSLKPSAQCAKAAGTARSVLGQISRLFHYRDKKTFVKLYVTYVRPHLEFCTPAWSPWTRADIDCLEHLLLLLNTCCLHGSIDRWGLCRVFLPARVRLVPAVILPLSTRPPTILP